LSWHFLPNFWRSYPRYSSSRYVEHQSQCEQGQSWKASERQADAGSTPGGRWAHPARSKRQGRVVEITAPGRSSGSRLVLTIDHVSYHGKSQHFTSNLRAMAVVRPNYGGPMECGAWGEVGHWPSAKILAMIPLLRHFVGWLVGAFRSREDLMLENLALRQQLLALRAKGPRRRLGSFDKVFWVALRKLWSGWKNRSCSSPQKRWCVGIAPASACTGLGCRGLGTPPEGNP